MLGFSLLALQIAAMICIIMNSVLYKIHQDLKTIRSCLTDSKNDLNSLYPYRFWLYKRVFLLET